MGNDIVSPPIGFRVQEGKSGIYMTHAALTPLIGPVFDEFLLAESLHLEIAGAIFVGENGDRPGVTPKKTRGSPDRD